MFASQAPLDVELTALDEVVPSPGTSVEKVGAAYLLSPQTNNSFIAVNRILKQGGKACWASKPFQSGGREFPAGTVVVPSESVSKAFMKSLAEELFLTIDGTLTEAQEEGFELSIPRVALYRSWVPTADEGWTRWLLEQYEFPFTTVHDAEIRAGALEGQYDVLILPSMPPDAIVTGHKKGTVPPQYVGGITDRGARNIDRFVKNGGTLVTLNVASHFAVDRLGLPVQDVLKELQPPIRHRQSEESSKQVKFACPGSLLRVTFDTSHPVAFGMPEEAPVMFMRSPAFTTHPSCEEPLFRTIAEYPGRDLLMSGYIKGESYLHQTVAAAEVPHRRGKVILLGFATQNRAQSHGTFKLLFNSLYYGAVR